LSKERPTFVWSVRLVGAVHAMGLSLFSLPYRLLTIATKPRIEPVPLNSPLPCPL
jgi:hypothetical protein